MGTRGIKTSTRAQANRWPWLFIHWNLKIDEKRDDLADASIVILGKSRTEAGAVRLMTDRIGAITAAKRGDCADLGFALVRV